MAVVEQRVGNHGRRVAALMAVLQSKAGARARPISAPRAASPSALIYYVSGKMFAILSVRGAEYVILKCDPALADLLRSQYTGVGHRTHLDKRYWIAVDLDADVPSKEIKRLVQHSYDLVCANLTRKQLAEIRATPSKKKRAPAKQRRAS
jgi:predicted DNA-binding protein (MmcQ/YjbR family)